MGRTKYQIGTKVMTTKGSGEVIGYDLEYSKAWRHIVKLDSGELWEGNHPCFYDCDIQVNLNN